MRLLNLGFPSTDCMALYDKVQEIDLVGSVDNDSNRFSGDAWFESQQGHRLFCSIFNHSKPRSLFPSYNFRFIINQSSFCSARRARIAQSV
jgi:hypothetical protein